MIKRDAHLIELTGLKLAKYIMLRLVDNHESIEQLSENFDNDVRFINSGVEAFLKKLNGLNKIIVGYIK